MNRYYFDHNATTPVAPQALQAMLPCLTEVYGNASSIHEFGQHAKRLLEQARRQVALLLNCRAAEVVFVSGGTEANNQAILGTVRNSTRGRRHVVTTRIEHPSVIDACRQLEKEGVEVTYLRAGSNGVVDPGDVRAALRPETVLITVMYANNELGTVQPVRQIAAIAREAGVIMHCDGVQATGKIPVDLDDLGVSLFSLSAHKIYGPKGVGALCVRKGAGFRPILFGGHHERDRRPGTENIPGIVGLGAAAELAGKSLPAESERLRALRDRLERALLDRIPSCGVNGAGAPRVPNTANIYFDGLKGDAMLILLDLKGMAVSSGAACSSGSVEPSHVLKAIGLSDDRARASIRFSLGAQNTPEQVEALIEAVDEAVAHLRNVAGRIGSEVKALAHS